MSDHEKGILAWGGMLSAALAFLTITIGAINYVQGTASEVHEMQGKLLQIQGELVDIKRLISSIDDRQRMDHEEFTRIKWRLDKAIGDSSGNPR